MKTLRSSDKIRRLACALILGSGVGPGRAPAEDAVEKPGKGVDYWLAAASKDQFAPASDPDHPLTFRKEPVLKWTNPLRRTDDGALFLWTDRGRPEVATSFWHSGTPDRPLIVHEFQTLAARPLVGHHEGRVVWSPKLGIALAPIPEAPTPAADAPGRLRQIRALARDFKAYLDNPAERAELRPLTQPLYRYETAGARSDVGDGCLFAFVHATDPEVLLLIESRAAAPGRSMAWHFGIGRMSGFPVHVDLKGKEVWRVDHVGSYADNTKPYWALGQSPP